MTDRLASGPEAITLRDVKDTDLRVFYEQQANIEASAMAAFPSRSEPEHIKHWHKVLADPTTITQTIDLAGEVVGNVVSWIQDGHREIGYWIGREYWGRGIASSALQLFVDQVSERPLSAWVAEHNIGSIRVLEKVGFTPQKEQPPGDLNAVPMIAYELNV